MSKNEKTIISSILDVNKDIIKSNQISKLPKFIKNFLYKKRLKRLDESLEKLKNSNEPLDSENLKDLFSCIFNNFQPDACFDYVTKVKVLDDNDINMIVAYVEVDMYRAIFRFNLQDVSNTFKLDMKIPILNNKTAEHNEFFSLELLSLDSKNKGKTGVAIDTLNKGLYHTMANLLKSIIYDLDNTIYL